MVSLHIFEVKNSVFSFILILSPSSIASVLFNKDSLSSGSTKPKGKRVSNISFTPPLLWPIHGIPIDNGSKILLPNDSRSEERRVGKECRSRWSPYH